MSLRPRFFGPPCIGLGLYACENAASLYRETWKHLLKTEWITKYKTTLQEFEISILNSLTSVV